MYFKSIVVYFYQIQIILLSNAIFKNKLERADFLKCDYLNGNARFFKNNLQIFIDWK
jgi:hypothetical protein